MGVSGNLVYTFRDNYVSRARNDLQAWGVMLASSVSEPLQKADPDRVADLVQTFERAQRDVYATGAAGARPRVTLYVFDRSGRLVASSRGAPAAPPDWYA